MCFLFFVRPYGLTWLGALSQHKRTLPTKLIYASFGRDSCERPKEVDNKCCPSLDICNYIYVHYIKLNSKVNVLICTNP